MKEERKSAGRENRTLMTVKSLVFETSAYTSSAIPAKAIYQSGAEEGRTPDLLHAMQALYQTELRPQITKNLLFQMPIP